MLPFARGVPQHGEIYQYPQDDKKEKVKAILNALDDDALMGLAIRLQDIGLLQILPHQIQTANLTHPPVMPLHMPSNVGQHVGTSSSARVRIDASMMSSGSAVQALPVGALPPGYGFPSMLGMPVDDYTPSAPATTPGHWAMPSSNIAMSNELESMSANPQDIGEGDERQNELAAREATTLILRNFPRSFDQQKARQWVDDHGYADKYDFFLWFPPKATSRLNACGYAFVNFRSVADSQRFLRELNQTPFQGNEEGSLPLSVTFAKIQGFVKNYTRFHPLLEGSAQTMCTPYFAKDSLEAMSRSTQEPSNDTTATVTPMNIDNVHLATTIIFRNLPVAIESTGHAKEWLDEAGYASLYDFLLYLPAKKTRPGYHGHGYAFANFKEQRDAYACMQSLQGKSVDGSDLALNIVAAKVQGKMECIRHFSSMIDGGRVTPWVDNGDESAWNPSSSTSHPPAPPRKTFQ